MGLIFNNKNSRGISEFLKYKATSKVGRGHSCKSARKKLTRKSQRLLRSLGYKLVRE